ncbi:hypothetical protein BpsM61_00074 [Bacillus phage vB_BpsM-61]|nr:hypothetical protein BpsM61_00074 [Bacillus phage vB_BpsM-61]
MKNPLGINLTNWIGKSLALELTDGSVLILKVTGLHNWVELIGYDDQGQNMAVSIYHVVSHKVLGVDERA